MSHHIFPKNVQDKLTADSANMQVGAYAEPGAFAMVRMPSGEHWSFRLTHQQMDKLEAWMKIKTPEAFGATGGRFTYSFTTTTVGTVVRVLDNCTNEEIDLTNYEEW